MMIRRVLISRRVGWYLVLIGVSSAMAWLQGRSAVNLDLATFRPVVRLACVEIVALMASVAGVIVMRPRMWHLERAASRRSALVAAVAALLGILAPLIVVLVGRTRVPGVDRAGWQLSNLVVLGAAVFVLAPLLGPVWGGALVVLGYFSHAVVVSAWTDLPWVPLTLGWSDSAVAHAHWPAAGLSLLIAVLVNARTRGLSSFAQRLSDRDE